MTAREQFEAWARRTHTRPGTHFNRARNGVYLDNRIAAKWAAWNAATACAQLHAAMDLDIARSLLRDVLAADDRAIADMNLGGLPLPEEMTTLTEQIREFLKPGEPT